MVPPFYYMKKVVFLLLACMACCIVSHAQLPKDPYENKTDKKTMQLNNTYYLDPKSSLGISDKHLIASCGELTGDISAFEITRGEKVSPFPAENVLEGFDGYYYKFKVKPIIAGTFTLQGTCSYVIKGAGTRLQSKKIITYIITVPQVESISIPSSKSLVMGSTYTFSPKILPSNVSASLTWSTSNKNVVTVNSSGKITAKAVGTATIKCIANNGVTATCKVTVTPIKVSSITLNNKSLSLNAGDTYQLKATASPSNAANKTVTWKCSNTSVATVSSSGVVTALAPGSCTITATSADGSNVSASCSLSVKVSIATIINKVEDTSERQESIYNLNGQKASGHSTHKGVYIVNGRKVVR